MAHVRLKSLPFYLLCCHEDVHVFVSIFPPSVPGNSSVGEEFGLGPSIRMLFKIHNSGTTEEPILCFIPVAEFISVLLLNENNIIVVTQNQDHTGLLL